MAYNIYYDEKGFIRFQYEGKAELKYLREVIDHGVALAREKDCYRVLSDFQKMTLDLSASDIFSVPIKQILRSHELDVPYYKFRRTMVVPENDFEKYKFFENVAVNRSHVIKIFIDTEEAISWLLSQ